LRQARLKLPSAARTGERQLADHLEVGIEHPREWQVNRRCEHLVEEASPSEDLERSRLNSGRACLMVRLRLALDDADWNTVTRQLDSREQP